MPQSDLLTSKQRADFDRRGVLHLPGFVPAEDIAAMAAAVWTDLAARLGVLPGQPETWTMVRPAHFQRLTTSGALDRLDSANMRRLADELIGEGGWTPPRHWGQPLVTLPAETWDLPRVMWHFDLPGDDYRAGLPGLRLFTLLEPVRPHGGGTLYVAGSHRLALDTARASGALPSASMRTVLRARHRWFDELCTTPGDEVRRFIGQPVVLGGVDVAVEEMTGEPGDLIVMHPLMLHGVAHNALNTPRMMVASTVWRERR